MDNKLSQCLEMAFLADIWIAGLVASVQLAVHC